MAEHGNEIGAVLPLSRKSRCVRLNMLKFISKPEHGQSPAPFCKVLFAARFGWEEVHICKDVGLFLFLSSQYHIWIGGPQIEKTENSSTAAPGK